MVPHCRARYDEVRKALGGIHMVEIGLWNLRHYDYLVQAKKDSMHGQEHGTCDKMLGGTVIVVCDLQNALKVRSYILIKRLFKRLHGLCNSSNTQWVTLSNQKLFVALHKHIQNYKKNAGEKAQSTVCPCVMQTMS
jgi:hypothetical protein